MIELKNVSKTFQTADSPVEAVRDVSLTIERGDIYGIIGLSGAGKSTLVRCINFLERPTAGQVLFQGVDLAGLDRGALARTRKSMSMIFQSFNLLSQRTALRNVCYPLEISKVPRQQAVEKARKLLELVGLTGREGAYPSQLSGGQKQRVAIARALATDPGVLLCDEATSALDPNTTRSILSLLRDINQKLGVTIVVITHEMKVVEQICNKVAVMEAGRIVESGLVREVFLTPKSAVARDLILPKNNAAVQKIDSGPLLRLVFDGQSVFSPMLSNLILECRTPVNILQASTQNIGGKVFGQMILQLPNDSAASARVQAFLTDQKIQYSEEETGDAKQWNDTNPADRAF